MARVLDFGGPGLDGTFAAFKWILGGPPDRTFALGTSAPERLDYRPFHGSLEDAEELLENGTLASIQVESRNGEADLIGGVYCPRFCGGTLSDWSASIEGRRGLDAWFQRLLDVPGLTYVSLARDASPDFEVEHLTAETFPWDDWRLKVAGARDPNGRWVVRPRPST